MILRKDGDVETKGEYDDESMSPWKDDDDDMEYLVNGELLVTRRALNVRVKNKDEMQCDNIFHTRC